MNTNKSMGLISLAVASLFAAPVFATTTCPTGTQGSPVYVATTGGDGAGSSLQERVDSMTVSGPGVDVYNGQASPSARWSMGATGISENKLVMEIAGNANQNSFGIFDLTNPGNSVQLFKGEATAGWSTQLNNMGNGDYKANYFDAGADYQGTSGLVHFNSTNQFGYYLDTPNGIFYSMVWLNSDETPHMVAYQGDGTTVLNNGTSQGPFLSNEFLLAWEDQPFADSDLDYNDFVVLVESITPVPEPAAFGMFWLGLLLIGGFAGLRRRRNTV